MTARFRGVDHFALSVTDVARSLIFYTEVLGFTGVMTVDGVEILMDRESGFTIALAQHAGGSSDPFTELNTGLDHLGLACDSLDELEEWVRRFDAAGVTYTPIREMPFGHHLNFRDPDGIPLELTVSSPLFEEARRRMRDDDLSRERIDRELQRMLGTSA